MKKMFIFMASMFVCILGIMRVKAATYTCSTTPLYQGTCSCRKSFSVEDTDFTSCNDLCVASSEGYTGGTGNLTRTCRRGSYSSSDDLCHMNNVEEYRRDELVSDGWDCDLNSLGDAYNCSYDGAFNTGTCTCAKNVTADDTDLSTCNDFCVMLSYVSGTGSLSPFCTTSMGTLHGSKCYFYNVSETDKPGKESDGLTCTANSSGGSSGGSGSTSYTITANANGGTITTTTGWTNSSDNTTATKSVNSGSTYGTLPTVTYTGKTLKEWNTKSDGTGTAVTSATTATATATIYAIWNSSESGDGGQGGQGGGEDQTETKTITFNANGGIFTVNNESKESIEVSGAVTSTLQQVLTVMPTKAGYKLDGWYTEAEGGYAVALENPLSDISVTTLYAHWSVADSELDPSLPISTLTYNSNGGTACAPSTKQVNTGNPWGELCTPTFKGYKFNGWFTAKTGGSKVTSETVANGDLTVYAQWRKATTVNPKTGIFTPIAAILLLGIVSSVTFLIVKRRSAGI